MKLINVFEINGKYLAKMMLTKTFDSDFKSEIICLVDDNDLVLGGRHINTKYGTICVTDERDILSAKHWKSDDYDVNPVYAVSSSAVKHNLYKLESNATDLYNDNMFDVYVGVDKVELGGGFVDYEFVLDKYNHVTIDVEFTKSQYETRDTYENYVESDDEKAAHNNYPYGSDYPVGTHERTVYYQRKEAFLAGIEYYKKLMNK